MVPLCSRNARPQKMGRVAWLSSCSRNAHDRNVLVRRAHSRIDQATLENEVGEGEAQRRKKFSLLPERAPSEGPRSTAAVETSYRPCRLSDELEERKHARAVGDRQPPL